MVGWADGLVGKVLAIRGGLEYGSREPTQKANCGGRHLQPREPGDQCLQRKRQNPEDLWCGAAAAVAPQRS